MGRNTFSHNTDFNLRIRSEKERQEIAVSTATYSLYSQLLENAKKSGGMLTVKELNNIYWRRTFLDILKRPQL